MRSARATDLPLDVRQRCLLEFGSASNAYFHFQEDLRTFHLPEVGFLTYHLQERLGRAVPMVFAKPLCRDADLRRLLWPFLAEHGRAAIFMGMDAATAGILGEWGFSVNEFGVECTLPIQEHRVAGRAMRHLRTVLHHGERGVTVRELPSSEVPREDLVRISEGWLRRHRVKDRELRFLTRPPVFEEEWRVRKFYCFKDGRLVGFVFFDPFFEAGRCIGYCANILRSEPDLRPAGILDYAILTAMKTFREEGLRELALGVCPLHDLQRHPLEDPLLRMGGRALYRWGSFLYNFRELAFHKARYRGEVRRLYFCKRGLGRVSSMLLGLRATHIL